MTDALEPAPAQAPAPAQSTVFTVPFDEFGWTLLDERAGREGLPLGALIARAAIHFESQLSFGRGATVVPLVARARAGAAREVVVVAAVELPEQTWERLADEAARREVSLDRLLAHATMCYIADPDSGRGPEFTA
jgi:predicted DNA-binding ribbon-helix-helix protein